MTAEEIDRHVRALSPWPGVTLPLGSDSSLKILATDLEPASGAAALPCKGSTTLYLVSVQVSGGKPVTGQEWERGRKR
jgi:methionyl-tRNA formyltransferase